MTVDTLNHLENVMAVLISFKWRKGIKCGCNTREKHLGGGGGEKVGKMPKFTDSNTAPQILRI